MTFEQTYKHALGELYKDELFNWLKDQPTQHYYVVVFKDNEIVWQVVDRNTYYKHYCNIDNTKKVIATVSTDKTSFSTLTIVINGIKQCLSKLQQKLFDKAYDKFIASKTTTRQEQIEFVIDYLSAIDSKALSRYLNVITEKTFEQYLLSKAYQQHLLRVHHFEQDAKTKALTKELANAKAQVKYYKDKCQKGTKKELLKELTAIKKMFSNTIHTSKIMNYLSERINDLRGDKHESLVN